MQLPLAIGERLTGIGVAGVAQDCLKGLIDNGPLAAAVECGDGCRVELLKEISNGAKGLRQIAAFLGEVTEKVVGVDCGSMAGAGVTVGGEGAQ